jgi:hypothetical protein
MEIAAARSASEVAMVADAIIGWRKSDTPLFCMFRPLSSRIW